ncbi:MAG: hypothetical protein PHT44_00185 [Candidatus Portnoybacteria bacterium]|nr:hypothetical protein [Candidatus Portnoybacteria bacterium]MDD4982963.1 hypothetical protein [Candidatus Portnoybacteria bacterium]
MDPAQQNFSMPGPQFGNGSNGDWLKRNSHRIAYALVALLLATGGFYFYRSYQDRTALLEPDLKGIVALPAPSSSSPAQANTEKAKGAPSPAPQAKQAGQDIVAIAAKGNGATHLARQALKEYLKDKPELAQKLKPEHRIFIEDYLQKHLPNKPKTLRIGQQLTFSADDFQAAIDKALALNDNQLKNLNKYVPLVPSLMTI